MIAGDGNEGVDAEGTNEMSVAPRAFFDLLQENPCNGCPAPCCRLSVMPLKVPETLTELDFIRFSLLFPGNECVAAREGMWSLVRWQKCAAFEAGTCTCTLHATADKPLVCVGFSPYGCWYKRGFTTADPPDIYRLDRARFDLWVKTIGLNDTGRIISVPAFDECQALLRRIPISPILPLDSGLIKPTAQSNGVQPTPAS